MNQKNVERDRLRKKLASNEAELEQLQHQQQRLENRIAYYEKADRKKRTHRLCTIAGTMESIAPELRELTTPEVIELLEQIFELSDVRVIVHNAVLLHREKEEKSIGSIPPERQAN
jgi:predicted nuclease with TOPRIM domain